MWDHIANKEIRFDIAKNDSLKEARGVTFEMIATLLEERSAAVLAIKPHSNPKKYSHQHIIVCSINNYIHMVPCVIEIDSVFLKTIFPSRKGTAFYLSK
jgi:uncharacterized DUF497 family protein